MSPARTTKKAAPKSKKRSRGKATHDEIAIVGMSCIFPGAPDLQTYWQNIVNKIDCVTEPPPEAWDKDLYYEPDSKENDRVYCKKGGYLGSLSKFDPLKHGIMPSAIKGGEPDQWLGLELAKVALEDAGYEGTPPEAERTSVIFGKGNYLNFGNLTLAHHSMIIDQTLNIIRKLHPEHSKEELKAIRREMKSCLDPFSADTVGGLVPNITAGRIANRLDLMGPSYVVDGACASSLLAMEIVVHDLLGGRIDMALIGGANIIVPIPVIMLFCQLGALARGQVIRPFDKNADGTILGEGIGMVVLKRRTDAERDGNRIYALIKGIGCSSDGRGVGILTPRVEGEELALRRAYEMAGIDPRSIGLIEAHGTATEGGDDAEIDSLTRVFGSIDGGLPWCGLGSVKSMISHLMPAAGIAGIIKAALSLYQKVLPPTLNVEEPNPKLQGTPFYVNSETRPWIHGNPDSPRRAGVNSFGFGGINSHVILEEYRDENEESAQSLHKDWDTEVFILEAETRPSLIDRANYLLNYLAEKPDVRLMDLAHTLNTKLIGAPYRLSIIATSLQDLEKKLTRAVNRISDPESKQIKDVTGIYFFDQPLSPQGKLAFLFPGEGAQYGNMLSDLSIHFPEVRACFDRIDRMFFGHTRKFLPSDFIFPRPSWNEEEAAEAEERLWKMDGAVEAVLTANDALYELLTRLELRPDALMGHSTGEYSAMRAAGIMDLTDESLHGQRALELNESYERIAAKDGIPKAVLVAVGAGFDKVATIIDQIPGDIFIAMDNCPHQSVIVGSEEPVRQAIEEIGRQGLIFQILSFDRPYHTGLFEAYAESLREFFDRWPVSSPQILTYSCTTMAPYPSDPAEIRELAVEHWVEPVEFRKTIEAMYADGFRIFVEVGARGNLTSFVEDILRGQPFLAMPANVPRRTGITQLNHLVGILSAHGVPMKLDHLYNRRSPNEIWIGEEQKESGKKEKKGTSFNIPTGWNHITISDEFASTFRRPEPKAPAERSAPSPPEPPAEKPVRKPPQKPMDTEKRPAAQTKAPPPPPAPTVTKEEPIAASSAPAAGASASPRPSGPESQARPATPAAGAAPPSNQALEAYMQTMERFLEVQQQVMLSSFSARDSEAGTIPLVGDLPDLMVPPPMPEPAARQASGGDGVPATPPQASSPAITPVAPAPAVEVVSTVPVEAPPPPPVVTVPEPVAEATPEPAAPPAAPLEAGGLTQILLDLVSEKTGYPPEMLDLDLDMEADLGIDSIKRVEILGALIEKVNLEGEQDIDELSGLKTLKEIIDFLSTHIQEAGAPPVSSSPPLRKAEDPARESSEKKKPFKMMGEVTISQDGRELEAHSRFHIDEDIFLHDHTMGREISVTDKGLVALPVVPLTMSIEILAEAGTLLIPDKKLIAIKEIRAHRWLALEEDELSIEVTAHRPADSENMVDVKIYIVPDGEGAKKQFAFEGTTVFGDHYPQPPTLDRFSLRGERTSKWATHSSKRLYDEAMFHGPRWQGVASVERWGEDGMISTLQGLPTDEFFRSDPSPAFVTDPVVLDAAGQIVGFWTMEGLETFRMVFPYRVEAMEFYGPNPTTTPEKVPCTVRSELFGHNLVRSDIDMIGPDGRLWMRLLSWEDKRFELPSRLYPLVLSPGQSVTSEPWPLPLAHFPDPDSFQCSRIETLCKADRIFWNRVCAYIILKPGEREEFRNLHVPEARQIEWLTGRVAAKDSVRVLLERLHGIKLCPADIEIVKDEHGQPAPTGAWEEQVGRRPALSMAHTDGVAVALAGFCAEGQRIGVDIEKIRPREKGFETMSFHQEELELLSALGSKDRDEWVTRFWCAKEAVGKALGRGLIDGPRGAAVQEVDTDAETVMIRLFGKLAELFPEYASSPIKVYTTREGDMIISSTICERG